MNNIVVVIQRGAKYLFSVPDGIKLKTGDCVKCDTRQGVTDGTVFFESMEVNDDVLPLLVKILGAKLPLKSVVGKLEVVMFENYTEDQHNKDSLPAEMEKSHD